MTTYSREDSPETLPLTDGQKAELDRRLAAWRERPLEGRRGRTSGRGFRTGDEPGIARLPDAETGFEGSVRA